MKNKSQKKLEQTVSRRFIFLSLLKGSIIGTIGWKLFDLQLVENRKYEKLSNNNQFNYRIIAPERGRILDRKMRQNKRKGNPTDFRSLDLPEQTKDYIPKYIALKELILNSKRYEIILPDIPYEPVVTKVVIPGQVEIYALSEYLQIKPELLYKLNAGYTKWASAPKDESIFYIPIDKQELFSNNNPFDTFDQINWISHSIQEGDSLWALAKKYDTEVKIVKEIKIPVQGGLDPKILLTDKEILKKEVEKYLHVFRDHPYIFNLGHGILPETKIEMVEDLIKIVRNFK